MAVRVAPAVGALDNVRYLEQFAEYRLTASFTDFDPERNVGSRTLRERRTRWRRQRDTTFGHSAGSGLPVENSSARGVLAAIFQRADDGGRQHLQRLAHGEVWLGK